MAIPDTDFRLSQVNLALLREVLRSRTGIVLQDYQMDGLQEIIAGACAQFGHPRVEDYLQALETGSGNGPEMEYLVTHVTVGESYFFRDEAQIRFLREEWLPGVIAAKADGDRSLRIWSAGCSAGQEVYTLAILLLEHLPEPETWSLHLLGTDINTRSLAQAVKGQYSTWSLRATADEVRRRYFHQDAPDTFHIDGKLRDRVKFSYLNLLEDSFPSMLTGTSAMDLVLCRNVFIYFDAEVVGQVMEKFKACLLPDGYLLLGASDLAAEALPGLELQQWGDTFCFRRTNGTASAPPRFTAPPPSPAAAPETAPAAPPAPVADAPPRRTGSAYPEIIPLLREERWEAVVEKIDELRDRGENDAELAQHRAKALANLGKLDEAAQESEQSIDLAPLDKHTYLIKALVMMELNNFEKAAEALRRAIFLEPNFVEAHFQLGLLQLRMGERKSGMRSLSNALELAERLDPSRQVHNAPGMVFGRLAEILRNEINVYGDDK